jgi:hypothetical protein
MSPLEIICRIAVASTGLSICALVIIDTYLKLK